MTSQKPNAGAETDRLSTLEQTPTRRHKAEDTMNGVRNKNPSGDIKRRREPSVVYGKQMPRKEEVALKMASHIQRPRLQSHWSVPTATTGSTTTMLSLFWEKENSNDDLCPLNVDTQ